MTEPRDTGSRTSHERPPGGSRLDDAVRALAGLGGRALRPAVEVAELARAAERRARREISRSASNRALGLLDAALASRFAEQAVERIAASALVEAAARDLVRYAVIDRVGEQLVAGDALERSLAAALDSPAVERMVARVI